MKYLQFIQKYPDSILLTHCTEYRINRQSSSTISDNSLINTILQIGLKSPVKANIDNNIPDGRVEDPKSRSNHVYCSVPTGYHKDSLVAACVVQNSNYCLVEAKLHEYCYDWAEARVSQEDACNDWRKKKTIKEYIDEIIDKGRSSFKEFAEYITPNFIEIERIIAFARVEKIFPYENLPQEHDILYLQKYIEFSLAPYVFFSIGEGENVKISNVAAQNYVIRVIFDRELVFGNQAAENQISIFFEAFESITQMLQVGSKKSLEISRLMIRGADNWQGEFIANSAEQYICEQITFAIDNVSSIPAFSTQQSAIM